MKTKKTDTPEIICANNTVANPVEIMEITQQMVMAFAQLIKDAPELSSKCEYFEFGVTYKPEPFVRAYPKK